MAHGIAQGMRQPERRAAGDRSDVSAGDAEQQRGGVRGENEGILIAAGAFAGQKKRVCSRQKPGRKRAFGQRIFTDQRGGLAAEQRMRAVLPEQAHAAGLRNEAGRRRKALGQQLDFQHAARPERGAHAGIGPGKDRRAPGERDAQGQRKKSRVKGAQLDDQRAEGGDRQAQRMLRVRFAGHASVEIDRAGRGGLKDENGLNRITSPGITAGLRPGSAASTD